jgi:hypothetical protein
VDIAVVAAAVIISAARASVAITATIMDMSGAMDTAIGIARAITNLLR